MSIIYVCVCVCVCDTHKQMITVHACTITCMYYLYEIPRLIAGYL